MRCLPGVIGAPAWPPLRPPGAGRSRRISRRLTPVVVPPRSRQHVEAGIFHAPEDDRGRPIRVQHLRWKVAAAEQVGQDFVRPQGFRGAQGLFDPGHQFAREGVTGRNRNSLQGRFAGLVVAKLWFWLWMVWRGKKEGEESKRKKKKRRRRKEENKRKKKGRKKWWVKF